MKKMADWKCPKCDARIQALATTVTHRCPSNKSQVTIWDKVEGDK